MEYPDNSYEVMNPYYTNYGYKRTTNNSSGANHVRPKRKALSKVPQRHTGQRQSYTQI